uniref:Uncharacterized protein n=1 Tax=Populus trichocarpa TaxID=3694 RepID=A0A2K2BBF7_POPTR
MLLKQKKRKRGDECVEEKKGRNKNKWPFGSVAAGEVLEKQHLAASPEARS